MVEVTHTVVARASTGMSDGIVRKGSEYRCCLSVAVTSAMRKLGVRHWRKPYLTFDRSDDGYCVFAGGVLNVMA